MTEPSAGCAATLSAASLIWAIVPHMVNCAPFWKNLYCCRMRGAIEVPRIRRPAVAGHFYPQDPQALRTAIAGYLARARPQTAPDAASTARRVYASMPKGLIAPHAGYVYSGPKAGS